MAKDGLVCSICGEKVELDKIYDKEYWICKHCKNIFCSKHLDKDNHGCGNVSAVRAIKSKYRDKPTSSKLIINWGKIDLVFYIVMLAIVIGIIYASFILHSANSIESYLKAILGIGIGYPILRYLNNRK